MIGKWPIFIFGLKGQIQSFHLHHSCITTLWPFDTEIMILNTCCSWPEEGLLDFGIKSQSLSTIWSSNFAYFFCQIVKKNPINYGYVCLCQQFSLAAIKNSFVGLSHHFNLNMSCRGLSRIHGKKIIGTWLVMKPNIWYTMTFTFDLDEDRKKWCCYSLMGNRNVSVFSSTITTMIKHLILF